MPRTSRNTKQKELIQLEIDKTSDFFTAEELYKKVSKKNSDIGLATVYRFLKDLRNKNKIHAYTCNNQMIYSREKRSHCHFICENTGKIIHFDIDSLDFLKNKIPGSITSFQIEVKGICEDCPDHNH